jgi:transcriptional regulator of arginine metabolism
MTKLGRLFLIREIISTHPVHNQEELRRELQRRGQRVTQATLSRDLRELGVSRAPDGKRVRYTMPQESEVTILRPLVGAEVLSIQANESLIVVRTLPGCAGTVGEFIDVESHPDIIGTIAGDNTVLVIPRTHKRTRSLLEHLRIKLIEGAS